MLSKAKIKYIRSLELKKNRKCEQLFVAEGPKLVGDLMGSYHCRLLVAQPEWLQANRYEADEVIEASADELSRASFLKMPQGVLALFEQKSAEWRNEFAQENLCLALDGVQDPGNLGTIIRLADWFGIEHIFCSENTVDAYSPKVVQATMGGLAHVKLHYGSLPQMIESVGADIPVYGTFLDGENLYAHELSTHGIIIMGNEGNGISDEVAERVNRRLNIPNYPTGRECAESLNVAIAAAVVCAEFRRRMQ